MEVFVGEGILLIESANRAGSDALTAVNAGRLAERLLKSGGDFKAGRTSRVADGIDPLNCLAGVYTASAADALAHIPHNGRIAHLFGNWTKYRVKSVFPNAELFRQGLKLTFAVALTVETVLRMVGQKQFQNGSAGPADAFGVGGNVTALIHNVVAGGFQPAAPSILHHANAAESTDGQIRMMAERGNLNADFFGSLHNSGAGGYRNWDAVNFNSNHFVGINMHKYHHSFCC